MPPVSKAQQALAAIALHNPEKLRGKNKGMVKMGKESLRHFAAAPTKGLPSHKKARKKR